MWIFVNEVFCFGKLRFVMNILCSLISPLSDLVAVTLVTKLLLGLTRAFWSIKVLRLVAKYDHI